MYARLCRLSGCHPLSDGPWNNAITVAAVPSTAQNTHTGAGLVGGVSDGQWLPARAVRMASDAVSDD